MGKLAYCVRINSLDKRMEFVIEFQNKGNTKPKSWQASRFVRLAPFVSPS